MSYHGSTCPRLTLVGRQFCCIFPGAGSSSPTQPKAFSFGGVGDTSAWALASSKCHLTQLYLPVLSLILFTSITAHFFISFSNPLFCFRWGQSVLSFPVDLCLLNSDTTGYLHTSVQSYLYLPIVSWAQVAAVRARFLGRFLLSLFQKFYSLSPCMGNLCGFGMWNNNVWKQFIYLVKL